MTLSETNLKLGPVGTDKGDAEHSYGGRSYLDVYEPLFVRWKDDAFDLIEIGVRNGGSMHLWTDYFSKARIHGIDIDPVCAGAATERVTITIGSQADASVLEKVVGACSDLRLVIDDGSHLLAHLLASFDFLWPKLASRGLYIMEDVSTTYWGIDEGWAGMKHNSFPLPMIPRSELDRRILGRIADMDHLRGDCLSLHASMNLLIFEKL